jgi:hypothetical protein
MSLPKDNRKTAADFVREVAERKANDKGRRAEIAPGLHAQKLEQQRERARLEAEEHDRRQAEIDQALAEERAQAIAEEQERIAAKLERRPAKIPKPQLTTLDRAVDSLNKFITEECENLIKQRQHYYHGHDHVPADFSDVLMVCRHSGWWIHPRSRLGTRTECPQYRKMFDCILSESGKYGKDCRFLLRSERQGATLLRMTAREILKTMEPELRKTVLDTWNLYRRECDASYRKQRRSQLRKMAPPNRIDETTQI